MPDGFEFIFLVLGVAKVAELAGDDAPHFPVLVEHIIAHVEGFEEHQP